MSTSIKSIRYTIVCCTLILLWGQAGYPHPWSALNVTIHDHQCIDFAKERDAFKGKTKITVGDRWKKHNKSVLELIASDGSSVDSRLCVVSQDMVQIVAPIQEGFWF
jgi:hypothetical protein